MSTSYHEVIYKGFKFPLRQGLTREDVMKELVSFGAVAVEYNHGKSWYKPELLNLAGHVLLGTNLSELANILGRSPFAIICKLDSFMHTPGCRKIFDTAASILKTKENTNMNTNTNMNNENSISLNVTMNELVDASIPSLKFYSVVYGVTEGINSSAIEAALTLSNEYTFKSLETLEVGDVVLVPPYSHKETAFQIATVSRVEVEQPTNYNTISYYKWIVCKFADQYNALKQLHANEKDLAKQVKTAQRSNVRANVIHQVLGEDFKPTAFLK